MIAVNGPSTNGPIEAASPDEEPAGASDEGLSPTNGAEAEENRPEGFEHAEDQEPHAEDLQDPDEGGARHDEEMSPAQAVGAVEKFVDSFDGVWNEVSDLLERSVPEPETPQAPAVTEQLAAPDAQSPSGFAAREAAVATSLLPTPPAPPAQPEPPAPSGQAVESSGASSNAPSEATSDTRETASAPYEKLRSLFGGRRRGSRQPDHDPGN